MLLGSWRAWVAAGCRYCRYRVCRSRDLRVSTQLDRLCGVPYGNNAEFLEKDPLDIMIAPSNFPRVQTEAGDDYPSLHALCLDPPASSWDDMQF